MNKTNIMFLIDTSGPGGAETVLFNLIINLDKKFKPFVILTDKGWLFNKLSGRLTVSIINGAGFFNISFIFQLIRFIIQNRIHIIHAHLLGSSVYGGIVGLLCRKHVICTLHGFEDIGKKVKYTRLKIFIIGLAAKQIICVSEHLRKYVENFFPIYFRKKLSTIYNGINIIEKSNKQQLIERKFFGFKKSDVLIGSIGNVSEAKGYDVLIKSAAIVNSKYPNCKFIVVGERRGSLYNNLIILRREKKLQSIVQFVGYQDDIQPFLGMLDIFLLPSISEGFSLATIEAMAAGVAVIATKSGGPQEIVKHNYNGLLIEPGNPKKIADAIETYIKNDDFKKRIAIRGAETVYNHFSIDKMLSEYEKIYSEF